MIGTKLSVEPDKPAVNEATEPPPLSPAALRALAEAQARRQAATASAPPVEIGGRVGPDPIRFGDWENGGIASDF